MGILSTNQMALVTQNKHWLSLAETTINFLLSPPREEELPLGTPVACNSPAAPAEAPQLSVNIVPYYFSAVAEVTASCMILRRIHLRFGDFHRARSKTSSLTKKKCSSWLCKEMASRIASPRQSCPPHFCKIRVSLFPFAASDRVEPKSLFSSGSRKLAAFVSSLSGDAASCTCDVSQEICFCRGIDAFLCSLLTEPNY